MVSWKMVRKYGANVLVGARRGAPIAAIAGLCGVATAGGPPVMPPLEMPFDVASVVSEFAVIAGTIMLAIIGIGLAIALGWKLYRRVKGVI